MREPLIWCSGSELDLHSEFILFQLSVGYPLECIVILDISKRIQRLNLETGQDFRFSVHILSIYEHFCVIILV
jgi:hypothetical protein